MVDTVERISDRSFKVIVDIPAKTEERNFDIEFLENQKILIENDIARNQVELAKVVELIALAKTVNVEKV